MNTLNRSTAATYTIDVQALAGPVSAYRGDVLIASSENAKVMYETRLPPAVYFPAEDVRADLSSESDLQTFCPFKGTASYFNIQDDGEPIANAAWTYADALPESTSIQNLIGFMPGVINRLDLGTNVLRSDNDGSISGPTVDWLMRSASGSTDAQEFTRAFARKLLEDGVAISRLSMMIWSLHPLIAGKNYVWSKKTDEVSTFAPSYEIHAHPGFVNSPLRHVSNGLGGVRQKLNVDYPINSFPIMEDLRAEGGTDYVAMPLQFSDGRAHVMSLTSDHPDGFTTANLGLIFECSSVVSRFFEVFMLKENAQSLLDTYVGQRSGARVLGGDIRRGDGDDINAAIMFCDMRGSTALEERMGRADYIALLNQFFETASDCVVAHQGEVLKFIGDAVLAVFPADDDGVVARANALQAARDIVTRLDQLRSTGSDQGCDCSIGMAFGGVTYGNVGSRERLDFTVIGQAANIAARLGDYGKTAGHRIVATDDFLIGDCQSIQLGAIALRNVATPVLCHAFDTHKTG